MSDVGAALADLKRAQEVLPATYILRIRPCTCTSPVRRRWSLLCNLNISVTMSALLKQPLAGQSRSYVSTLSRGGLLCRRAAWQRLTQSLQINLNLGEAEIFQA